MMIKKIIYLMVLIPSMGFAQLTLDINTGELGERAEEQDATSSESPMVQDYEYNFRAKDYFATRYEGSFVDPAWPDQVTFEQVEMSLEDFEKFIIGKWQVMFSCDGRPLTSHEILSIDLRKYDGYSSPAVIFEFDSNQNWNRYIRTPIRDVSDAVEREESFIDSSTYFVKDFENAVATIVSNRFADTFYSLNVVQETGEKILTFVSNGEICPSGNQLINILVNLDSAPSS